MAQEEKVTTQTKLAILAAGLLAFIGILVETSLNVTFPTLLKTFSVSLNTIQWVTSGYLLMVTLVMSTTAFLIQRFDARTLFRTAITAFLCGTLLCVSAQSFPMLMGGRLLQAISTGLATPLMFHIIMSLVPDRHLGIYVGLAGMITSFAPALGPTYGGTLTYLVSWRLIGLGTMVLPAGHFLASCW